MPIARKDILLWLHETAAVMAENKALLTQLDSDIGDGDHGANMQRGFQAVVQKLPELEDKDIGTILKTAGLTLVSTVGGASGPLYGTMFLQMGSMTMNKDHLDLSEWTAALQAGLSGVVMRGKANPGDKTLVDVLQPALAALAAAGENGLTLQEALLAGAQAAEAGMRGTIPMLAKKGRASYLGERSIGHQDPGATSANLLLQTAAHVWRDSI